MMTRRVKHSGKRAGASRRGLLMVELLIALAITAMVGLGVASMMTMVGRSELENRDSRSVLLRTHAMQVRMRSYFQPALAILDYQGVGGGMLGGATPGMALWLHDERPEDNVHLTELRVIWFDEDAGSLSIERVAFPEGWSKAMKQAADIALPADADYFQVMETKRAEGHTKIDIIGDEIADFAATFNQKNPIDSERVALALWVEDSSGETHEVLMAFGLPNHRKPNM